MSKSAKDELAEIFDFIPKDGSNIVDSGEEDDDNGYSFVGTVSGGVSFENKVDELNEKASGAPVGVALSLPAKPVETPPVVAPPVTPPVDIEELLNSSLSSVP